jgi:signal transduction histidine kinase/DNA-binding response OmpR family regulator/CHASE3 domain sensor protein
MKQNMKLKNIKISIQLRVGFAILLLFAVILGAVGYIQSNKIHQQTETLYLHPLKTRRTLEEIRSNVLNMRMNIRDFLLVEDATARQNVLNEIAVNQSNVQSKTEDLKNCYLGPRQDIEDFNREFTKWVSIRQETIRMVTAGKLEEARLRHVPGGVAPSQATIVLNSLQKISDFALHKGDELYANSSKLTNSLNNRLITLIAIILLLSILINYILLRNIRKPLDELTNATRKFQKGNLNTRSSYTSKNEFGVLSESFNALAESIQDKTEIDEKFASLAALMLSEYDIKKFFQATLNLLAEHTSSQMAAIYLLSDDKKSFSHYESIGIDDNARQSFAVDRFEGEFGAVISTKKVQHIKSIPEDTRFTFQTVSGRFIPREIITIPIIADNEIVAIISLASVNIYSPQSLRLIDRIHVTLCARVEGILAFHKIKEFSGKLEHQNRELEAQKTELASQSAELVEQNTELEMQKKQLGEASRLKTNFLSNMSHELRTPLNSVIALSGVLNRRLADKIPEEEYSYLEVIERNGKHLLELINDILDISRIESGKEEVEIRKFNANSLLTEVISMIQPQARQKNIELIHSSVNTELIISSDSGKIRHILQNLITNAVKFTERGEVEVIASKNGKNLEISITDTGIGILEEHIQHIFDEFRQADGSTSRRFGGTGLGLAIAKKYANLLGGTISVKSTHGKGSTFTLTIPENYSIENQIIDTETISVSKYGIKPNVKSLKTDSSLKTILLVDDSEPAIIQLKDILGEYDYNILIARNGFEALEIISKSIPDAMILDLMMPGIDGFEVLKTLRDAEATAHVPVLILTAKQITKEELAFLKRNNVHQLIQKGDVKRNELLNAVSTMLHPKSEETTKPHLEKQIIEGKPIVLVVEDNHDNMITVKALLSDKYSVIGAEDGKESIALAMEHRPNLILMDIALPEMDGIEAFKTIRNDDRMKHIPVIALTASAMISDRETILAHGFDAYIAKPIDENEFFKTINETLYGK